jgi:dTDP-4-dehydrorhamnose 3,5-epimerase
MLFLPAKITGTWLIEPEKLEDERGFFARTFCSREFEERGLKTQFVQSSISFSPKKGTLRGLHFQIAPHEEAKLVYCTRGVVYDVLIDLRRKSPSFGQWMAVQLTAESRRMLYVPEGVAHGFQTLVEGAEVFYQISEYYDPNCSRGVRWNDPAFGVLWPLENPILSQRDRNHVLWPRNGTCETISHSTA